MLVTCVVIAATVFRVTADEAQPPVQSQETNISGVVAEFAECRSKDGVLTVKIRLRNTSEQPAEFHLITNRNYDDFYVTAGSKKYYVLRDAERDPLAVGADGFGYVNVNIPKGGAYMWWAKYPSPPADQTKINYITPFAAPFEDVPVAR